MAGPGFKCGETPGKMVFWEPIVQFLQSGTGPTSFKWRIRLEVSITFHHSIFKEHLVGLAQLLLITERLSRFLFLNLMGKFPLWLVIGIQETTRLVSALFVVSLNFFKFKPVLLYRIFWIQALRADLDAGKELGIPDGVLINGKGPYQYNTTLVPAGIQYETIQVHPGNVLIL